MKHVRLSYANKGFTYLLTYLLTHSLTHSLTALLSVSGRGSLIFCLLTATMLKRMHLHIAPYQIILTYIYL